MEEEEEEGEELGKFFIRFELRINYHWGRSVELKLGDKSRLKSVLMTLIPDYKFSTNFFVIFSVRLLVMRMIFIFTSLALKSLTFPGYRPVTQSPSGPGNVG